MKKIITDKFGNVIYRDGIKIPYGSNSSYNVLINLDVLRGLYNDIKNQKWLKIKYYGLGRLKGKIGDYKSSSNKLIKIEVYAIKISDTKKEETARKILDIINMVKDRRHYEEIIEELKSITLYFDYFLVKKISPKTGKVVYLKKRNIPTKYKPAMTFKLSNIKIVKYKRIASLKREKIKKIIKSKNKNKLWL